MMKTKTSPSIQRRRLGNQLYDILRERIASFRFLSGKKLDLETLAEELEVSRPPLWEAVCRLEQEGLVEIKPNRGVYVVELSWTEAADLYQVRGQLEALAARLAAPVINPMALAEFSMHLDEHKKLTEDDDWYRFSPMDHNLHAVIYNASGNRMLVDTLMGIKTKLGTIRLDIQPLLADLYEQHSLILAALREHDPVKAVESVLAHNQYMEDYCRGLALEQEKRGRFEQA